VVEARAKATQMQLPADVLSNPQAFHQFEQNQAALGGALGRLLAVSENYPDLKSNENFLALQSQLEGTENRISVARRDYILAVQEYNTALRSYPGRWLAAWFYPELKVRETFTITEQAQQVPKVTSDGRELHGELVADAGAVVDELVVDVRATAAAGSLGGGGGTELPGAERTGGR
jgi:LemA protein